MTPSLQAVKEPDVDQNFRALGQGLDELRNAMIPTGTILATARSEAPAAFLLCDGTAVSRTDYANLFTAIGTTYGAGDGTTTFNVPDLRGRVPVGVDGAAGRVAANDALGNSAGTETHTLTEAQMPAHVHTVFGALVPRGAGADFRENSGVSGNNVNSGSKGGGTAHPNMQPYQVVNYMVKL